nr:uncharacterized protein LOC127301089 isoform X2 [Lolium perenne]
MKKNKFVVFSPAQPLPNQVSQASDAAAGKSPTTPPQHPPATPPPPDRRRPLPRRPGTPPPATPPLSSRGQNSPTCPSTLPASRPPRPARGSLLPGFLLHGAAPLQYASDVLRPDGLLRQARGEQDHCRAADMEGQGAGEKMSPLVVHHWRLAEADYRDVCVDRNPVSATMMLLLHQLVGKTGWNCKSHSVVLTILLCLCGNLCILFSYKV